MNYNIFLDDIREPYWIYDNYSEWIVIRNDIDFKNFKLVDLTRLY